jgi:histidine ammonia-lyase
LKAGVTVEAAYQRIRARIPHVDRDRALAADIERMVEIMKEDEFTTLAS